MAVLSAVSLAMAVSGCGGRAASDDTAANSSGKGEVSQGVSGILIRMRIIWTRGTFARYGWMERIKRKFCLWAPAVMVSRYAA